MNFGRRLAAALEADGAAVLVTIIAVDGSAPREVGARMALLADRSLLGTIGGGVLEFEAIKVARAGLEGGDGSPRERRFVLGPALGQCCGGAATLRLETLGRADAARFAAEAAAEAGGLTPLLLFGAGHVGRALVMALAPLPFAVQWIDARAEAFPAHAPGTVTMRCVADPVAVLAAAPAGALVAVMTHSHALDFALVAQALADARFPYVGLIGSDTKRARFASRLAQAGMNAALLVCPIGGRAVRDKAPAVIAALAAVELLAARERAL